MAESVRVGRLPCTRTRHWSPKGEKQDGHLIGRVPRYDSHHLAWPFQAVGGSLSGNLLGQRRDDLRHLFALEAAYLREAGRTPASQT